MYEVKALVSTIEPIDGGVPSMTRWICTLLKECHIRPVLSWYAPWSNHPDLSVPLYQLLKHKPRLTTRQVFCEYQGYGIGSWLPELEFTHYLPTKSWKGLIRDCQLHLSVSGNPLCATSYSLLGIPFIAWIATPWKADRRNRIRSFGFPRKLLDTVINAPVLSRLEKRVLRSTHGKILPLSRYTANQFEKISGRSMQDIMLMPVNTDIFYPNRSRTKQWKIGFSGRYCDPRKNIDLLLQASKIIRSMGFKIEVILVGEKDPSQLESLVHDYSLEDIVLCKGHMEPEPLASLLQTLDIFVIPSYQEGLCISALEAMACGVPVISTRCGGPEEYVLPGITGRLIDSTPYALAEAISSVCQHRQTRESLSLSASEWVTLNASMGKSRSIFRSHLIDLLKATNQLNILGKEVVI